MAELKMIGRRAVRELKEALTGTARQCSELAETVSEDPAPEEELRLASEVELAIDRLKAVSNFLRGRQDDREDAREKPDGDEWRR